MFSSPQEIAVIAAVGFILFGSKKLPEMARSFGTSIVEFKKAIKGVSEPETAAENPPASAAQTAVPPAPPQQLALPAQSSDARRA